MRGGVRCIGEGEGGGGGLGAACGKGGGSIETIEDGGVVGDRDVREGGGIVSSGILDRVYVIFPCRIRIRDSYCLTSSYCRAQVQCKRRCRNRN